MLPRAARGGVRRPNRTTAPVAENRRVRAFMLRSSYLGPDLLSTTPYEKTATIRKNSCGRAGVPDKLGDVRSLWTWRAAFVATASIALVAGQDPPKAEPGEQIVNNACTTCHDLRPIETQALDEAGWTQAVKANIDRGARVKADDVPILVAYLVKQHGPLPDGPGKEELLNICTRCHDLQRVRRERQTAEGWLEILDAMLNEGAPITDKDLPVLLRYLARNFGPAR
jgi:hypothetical protein